jgi:hypothetical protein
MLIFTKLWPGRLKKVKGDKIKDVPCAALPWPHAFNSINNYYFLFVSSSSIDLSTPRDPATEAERCRRPSAHLAGTAPVRGRKRKAASSHEPAEEITGEKATDVSPAAGSSASQPARHHRQIVGSRADIFPISTSNPLPPPPLPGLIISSAAKRYPGRPFGKGVGKHRTEQYRLKEIPFQVFKYYDFPKGPEKPVYQHTEKEKKAIHHRDEVAEYVIQDFYEKLTDGVNIPKDAPVDYPGNKYEHYWLLNFYVW